MTLSTKVWTIKELEAFKAAERENFKKVLSEYRVKSPDRPWLNLPDSSKSA